MTELSPERPASGRTSADHYELAQQMRENPGVPVLVVTPSTRKAALEARRRIRTGYGPYRRGGYVAEMKRNLAGGYEAWGRYVGGDPR